MSDKPVPRRQLILEALVRELEANPGKRITTAQLARGVGVSEAALYRHFPSKAKMFDALIEFIEDTVFGLVNRIMSEDRDTRVRCEKVLAVLLGFAGKNPGMTRILIGDALTGEHERLRERTAQFFERLETQFKQILREGRVQGEQRSDEEIQAQARLLLAVVEGHMHQFLRNGFRRAPLEGWPAQWQQLSAALFG
ncbi:MAG: nucleoid occlusion factor SlmA [Granulosicoccaceae bacterium]